MEKPLVVERTFEAPITKVWDALTDKDNIAKWFIPFSDFKLEPGFEFTFTGVTKEGEGKRHLCRVVEVIPDKKLSYSWRYDGHPGDSLVTWELEAAGDRTKLKLTHAGLDTFPKSPAFARDNFREGWTAITSALQALLEKRSMNEGEDRLVITRMLDAKRERVWKTCKEPTELAKWWGQPKGASMPVCEVDFRVGGSFYFKVETADGRVVWSKNFYKEIVEAEKIVLESHFSDEHGDLVDSADWPASTITLKFEDAGSGTKLTIVHEGMASALNTIDQYEAGWGESLDRLEKSL